jgi:hypothetical protein
MTVLGRRYAAQHKEAVFETLKGFVGLGTSGPESSYEEAAKTLKVGLGTVKTLIHRLREQYLAVVREEIAAPFRTRAKSRARSVRFAKL